jgi:adenylylsulfate kinase
MQNTDSHSKKALQIEEISLNQEGVIIWMTGLSGSGKTTLSIELGRQLVGLGKKVYVLDGDIIRKGLNSDLGFSMDDRKENIRRIGEVAYLFADAAMIVIVAFISPFRKDRDAVRNLVGEGRFIEIYLDCPLEVCEERDIKGLYEKARKGKVKDFTGISSPYEPPLNPEIALKTGEEEVEVCIEKTLELLKHSKVFSPETVD